MKYGLNQWARVASLLVRKSAKQCKARWYEWLDPSIKKTEWTREEDEKLLHLAKLMPTQWRTIAPIVGRTPTQCLERYEKLLDAAAGREGYDARDDPRRLRPGEIDPHPETKPARPDAVDMDEDEKEMLSEARARMANTRGKKAKRKAREKQLEEARRLASLQKKRELKAAGIEVRDRAKRMGGIDYSSEVAFERRPAPGFYDVGEEDKVTREMQEHFRPITKAELDRGRKEADADRAKKDLEKQKMADRKNVPAAVAREIAANEGAMGVRRGKMMLPAPQVTDAELEVIARHQTSAASGAGGMDIDGLIEGGSEATRGLLGDYATPARGGGSGMALPTPARTPLTGAGDGRTRVMLEAQNLARLQQGQTPLLGGDNPELHPSDFSGVMPSSVRGGGGGGGVGSATAGVSATPSSLRGQVGVGVGVGGSAAAALTHPSTAMRDALGLNANQTATRTGGGGGGGGGVGAQYELERLQTAMVRSELRSGLSQLPAPKNEYQVVIPEEGGAGEEEGEEEEEEGGEEDAAERDARLKAAKAAAIAAERRRRSQVLQRGLPRPVTVGFYVSTAVDGDKNTAAELIHKEVVAMVQHDNAKYPINNQQQASGTIEKEKERVEWSEGELQAARKILDEENKAVRAAMGHALVPLEEYIATWQRLYDDRAEVLFVPSRQEYVNASALSHKEQVQALQIEFENVRKEMGAEAKVAAKYEKKIATLLGGLVSRNQRLVGEVEEAVAELGRAEIELKCFQALHEQEQRAAPDRLEGLSELVARQQGREKELQERYREASVALKRKG